MDLGAEQGYKEPILAFMLACSSFVLSSITVVTWNVGTAMPPNDVTSLLHLNTGETNDVDMIAIG